MDASQAIERDPDSVLGGSVALLLLQMADWIHRRVETLHFLDAQTMRRQVSVDFEIPGEELIAVESVPVVPLALLEKEVLVDFDLRDENGASVPLLTRKQNRYVAWSTLVAVAEYELEDAGRSDETLEPDIRQDLLGIVSADWSRAEQRAEDFSMDASTSQREVLMDSDFFMGFVWDFASNFLLLTPCSDEQGTRRILKYSYAQEVEIRAGKYRERLLGTMGWVATQFDFDVPTLGSSESYHLEFEAPSGLPVADSVLTLRDDEKELSTHSSTATRSRAHVYVSERSPETSGTFSVWLWPSRAGLLRASFLIASVSAALFLSLLWDDRILRLSGDSAAALLLAIPGLIAAFIVRPGEHGLVTDLVRGIRAQVAIVGAAAYSGALALVGSVSDRFLLNTWRMLAVLSVICFVSLGIAYFGLSPKVPSGSPESGEGG